MPTFEEFFRETQREQPETPLLLLLDASRIARGRAALTDLQFARLECMMQGDLADELGNVAPYLAQWPSLATADPALLRKLLADGMAVWLLPPVDPAPDFAALHRHLRKFNVAYAYDGDPVYLRYADRNVLPALLAVLTPPQQAHFFGPLERIALIDADGQFQHLDRAGLPPPAGPVALTFSEAQMHALTLRLPAALLFDLEQFLRGARPQLFDCYPGGYLRWVIQDTVALAAPFRIDDVYSLRAFLALRFSSAPGFFKEPRIAAVLAQTARPAAERLAELATEPYAQAWVDAQRFDGAREWRGRLWGEEFDRIEGSA
ncbi:MAG: DUF4123 domain-containing protein [Betaproteobacteria bacterium]